MDEKSEVEVPFLLRIHYAGNNAQRIREFSDSISYSIGDGIEIELAIPDPDNPARFFTNYSATVTDQVIKEEGVKEIPVPDEVLQPESELGTVRTTYLLIDNRATPRSGDPPPRSRANLPTNEPLLDNPSSAVVTGNFRVTSGNATTTIAFSATFDRNASGVVGGTVKVTNFLRTVRVTRP